MKSGRNGRKKIVAILFATVIITSAFAVAPAAAQESALEKIMDVKFSQDSYYRLYNIYWGVYNDVTTDANNDIIVAGQGGNWWLSNFWVAKYDPVGNLLWIDHSHKGGVDDDAAAVDVDSNGNIIAAGGGRIAYYPDIFRGLLYKYSPTGSILWNINGPYGTVFSAVGIDNNNNVIVGGELVNNAIYLAKYSGNGEILFEKIIDLGARPEAVGGVTTDKSGNIITVGYTQSIGAGGSDFWMAKYDSNGNEIWNRTFGGLNDDGANVVTVDDAGNIYVSGVTLSFGAGREDIQLLKLDPNGNIIWNKTAGGSGRDWMWRGLELDKYENLVIVGSTKSFGAGGYDLWLLIYDKNGNQLANMTDGGSFGDTGHSAAINKDGEIVAVGKANDPNPEWYWNGDLWITKYKFRPPIIIVDIDIKPGSFPNAINPASKGVIPVAILTNETFDASSVDPTTVKFGRTGTEASPVQWTMEDVDYDGDLDMILHFKTQETGIQPGDIEAKLTGKTLKDISIEGTDSIKTVPK